MTWIFEHSDFLSVCVSLLALIAAVVAGFNARKILMIELRRDGRERDDRKASQAKLVSCWLETKINHSTTDVKALANLWGFQYLLVTSNASTQPIYKVQARIFVGEKFLREENFASLPPSTQERRSIPSEELHVALKLPIDKSVLYTTRLAAESDAIDVSELVSCEISFTDSSGGKWLRNTEGVLSRQV